MSKLLALAAALPSTVKMGTRVIVNYGTKADPVYYTAKVSAFGNKRGKDTVTVDFDDGDQAVYYALVSTSGILGRAATKEAREKPIPKTQLRKWVNADDLAVLAPDNSQTQAKLDVAKIADALGMSGAIKAQPNGKSAYALTGEENKTFGQLREAFSALQELGYKELIQGTLESARGTVYQFFFTDSKGSMYAVYRSYEDNTFALYIGKKAAFSKELRALKSPAQFKVSDYADLSKIEKRMGLNQQDASSATQALRKLSSGDYQRITSPRFSGSIVSLAPLVFTTKQMKGKGVGATRDLYTLVFAADQVVDQKLDDAAYKLLKSTAPEFEFDKLLGSTQVSGLKTVGKLRYSQWTVRRQPAVKPNPQATLEAVEQAEKLIESLDNR